MCGDVIKRFTSVTRTFNSSCCMSLYWQAERKNSKIAKPPPDVAAAAAERLASLETQSKQLLRGLPPHGARFADYVEHTLEREKNWVRHRCQYGLHRGSPHETKGFVCSWMAQAGSRKTRCSLCKPCGWDVASCSRIITYLPTSSRTADELHSLHASCAKTGRC